MATRYANRTGMPIYLPGKGGGRQCFQVGQWTMDSWYSRFAKGNGSRKLTEETFDSSHEAVWKPDRAPRQAIIRDQLPVIPPKKPARATPSRTPFHVERIVPEKCELSCQITCEQAAQVIAVGLGYTQVGETFYCKYCEAYYHAKGLLESHQADDYHRRCLREEEEAARPREAVGTNGKEPAIPIPPPQEAPCYEPVVVGESVPQAHDVAPGPIEPPTPVTGEGSQALGAKSAIAVAVDERAQAESGGRYCQECQKALPSVRGYQIHRGRMHRSVSKNEA